MNILSKEIIKEWNLGTLEESKQREAVSRIARIIYQAILVKSLDILSEKEEEELDSLLDKDDTSPEDVLKFLHSKIPTFEKLLKEESKNLKESIVVPAY